MSSSISIYSSLLPSSCTGTLSCVLSFVKDSFPCGFLGMGLESFCQLYSYLGPLRPWHQTSKLPSSAGLENESKLQWSVYPFMLVANFWLDYFLVFFGQLSEAFEGYRVKLLSLEEWSGILSAILSGMGVQSNSFCECVFFFFNLFSQLNWGIVGIP